MDNSADQRHMRRALALAAQGVALTSPNPCVGAVLVSAARTGDVSGEVIGEGSRAVHADADRIAAQVAAPRAAVAAMAAHDVALARDSLANAKPAHLVDWLG